MPEYNAKMPIKKIKTDKLNYRPSDTEIPPLKITKKLRQTALAFSLSNQLIKRIVSLYNTIPVGTMPANMNPSLVFGVFRIALNAFFFL